jgi:hypothetical protein
VLSLISAIENNTLQIRPAIPRRSSVGRIAASHQPLITSQIHNHHEQKYSSRHLDSDIDHDESVDSAIESHSLSNNNTSDDNLREVIETYFFDFIQSKHNMISLEQSSTIEKNCSITSY